jgi:DNA mismatch repair protein MutS2
VRAARSEAEQLIRALRDEQRKASLDEKRQSALATRSKLVEVSQKIERQIATILPEPAGEAVDSVKSGDRVMIPRFNIEGYVLEGSNSGGDALVQVGALKMSIPLNELRRSGKKAKANSVSINFPAMEHQAEVSDEAMEKVDKYLDSAYLSSLPSVNLIHGKGTGALREALRQYLAQHPFVDSYRSGGYYEGGNGVTVVTFK